MTDKRYVAELIEALGDSADERTRLRIENRWNGETWILVDTGGSWSDPQKPFSVSTAVRLTDRMREQLIEVLDEAGAKEDDTVKTKSLGSTTTYAHIGGETVMVTTTMSSFPDD